MKLSTKCKYGIRAIFEIAISQYIEKEMIKRKQISKNQRIPDSYLENILILLKNGGIINSNRGRHGGYFLNKPAEQTTLYEVIRALEGRTEIEECLDNVAQCKYNDCCKLKKVWEELLNVQKNILENVTVADLISSDGNDSPCFSRK